MDGRIVLNTVKHLDILMCPACRGDLKWVSDTVQCGQCRNDYQVEEGIPLLFWPHETNNSKEDITPIVKAFYEANPFPNYDGHEDISDLMERARQGLFARLLNEQVPFHTRILEVGCGTGQLTNFLGVAQRDVVGTDLCLNSLKLAQRFKIQNKLNRVSFYQMNLFRPIFKDESFHLVICNGVLHHTNDPFGGFQSIARVVKKGGYIIIGLYNRYGRIVTDIRRVAFNLTRARFKSLDPYLRFRKKSEARKTAWFMDQYKHPCESKHTMGEVLRWFKQTDFQFISGIPNPKAFIGFSLNEQIFNPHPPASRFDHLVVQASMILNGGREGGLFIFVGRKKYH